MPTRGRPPGWKKAQVLQQQAEAASAPPLAAVMDTPLPAHARENPAMLSGDALRALAHRMGIAKSDAARMSDEKIREQLKYAIYRRYEDDLV